MCDLDISNLNCPQYVYFGPEITKECLSINDLETSPASSFFKDYDSSRILAEEQNSVSSDVQDQQELGSYSLRSGSSFESYPVIKSKYAFPGNVSKNSKGKKTTKVRPFNTKATAKRKREDEYIPMAEQIAAFHRKTPERFHTTAAKAFQPTKHWSPPSITQPISPNLQACKRVRVNHVMSQEEKEAQEVEEMKRYRFRARPVKNAILQRRESLKIAKKPSTKPKDIVLRTSQRAAETNSDVKVDEEPYVFHAKPVPLAILNGPTGLKEKPIRPLTEPKTPNLTLKKRAEMWKSRAQVDEAVEHFKAQPMPISDPFEIKHETKCTDVKPFSFDFKVKEKMMEKERKLTEEKENTVFEFKAQPMPSPTPSALPAVPKKPLTQPEPFSFDFREKSSFRSSHSSFNDQPCISFKAQPAIVLKKPPFVPEKPEKHSIEVKEFQLHTDIRASERLKLKELNDIKEQERALALQRLKQLEEEEERREIERLRREAVHKANPIRFYAPVEIKPSSKPLTQPISPKFKTDERLQNKHRETS